MTRFYHSSVSCFHRPASVRSLPSKIVSILLAFSVFFAVSCEEDPTTIGKNILPGTDFVAIGSIDTLTAVSYTMYDSTTRSDNPASSYIGQAWDPYFGTTTASFVTQLRLKEEWDAPSFIVDSIKLVIQFSSLRGAAEGTHYLNLFEIDQDLNTDSTYYTNTPVSYAGFSLVGIPLPELKADTINDIVINFPRDINERFPLADRLLQDTSKLFHSNNQDDFRSYFKGLHFTITSEGDPVLATLSLTNNNDGYLIIDRYYKSFFILYYHDPNDTPDPPAMAYYFMIDAINKNASYNIINHDFSTALEENRIENVNNFYRDTLSYLQYLNGVYTRIVFPGLPALKANPAFANIAVNKARLTVPYFADEDQFKDATTPRQLYMRYRTSDGSKPIIPDYTIDQYHSFFDGLADTTRHEFNFNLATFMQAYLEDKTGKILPELEIFQASSNRNMIFRANNSTSPLKFELTYTQF